MSKLSKLPKARDLMKMYGIRAQENLSQNFIFDKNVTDKIVAKAGIKQSDSLVVEVGPGPGILTRSIIDTGVKNIVAVEKDKRFMSSLSLLSEESDDVLKVLEGDIMTTDHQQFLQYLKEADHEAIHLIGNLPFNIATPLLMQWISMTSKRSGIFRKSNITMTLMFQMEVADRIVAVKSTPSRCRLSVMVQSVCEAKRVYQVPSKVFIPKPDINAAVVSLKPLTEPMLQSPIESLEQVSRYFFNQKRKTIRATF
ncbi:3087_t:CDS:2, partial [Paraglomus brasilianum]